MASTDHMYPVREWYTPFIAPSGQLVIHHETKRRGEAYDLTDKHFCNMEGEHTSYIGQMCIAWFRR
jgi:hypothetical protein